MSRWPAKKPLTIYEECDLIKEHLREKLHMCDQNMGLCLHSCLINLKVKSRSYMSSPLLLFDKWRANLLREDLDPCLKDLAQFDFLLHSNFVCGLTH